MINRTIIGYVVSVQGPSEGPSRDRSYTVEWIMPDGSKQTIDLCGTREYAANEQIERRAFSVGFPVIGMVTDGGSRPSVMITDREDYAMGCEPDPVATGQGGEDV